MARKRKGQPIHGWLVVDKPSGLSSGQVVGRVKRLLDAQKVGHGGTLDPLATGVLPLALGEATKTVSFVMDGAKVYRFTVKWGEATDTLDAEGEVTETSEIRPTAAAIEAVLPRYIGTTEQVPPVYSALKVDGQRAYKLARDGEAPEMAPRPITIEALRLLAPADSSTDPDHAEFEVFCQKGTYVRALARDIAASLGTVGHVVALRRTQSGPFGEKAAISLDSLEALGHSARLEAPLLSIMTALDDIPALALDEAEAGKLRQGNPIALLAVLRRSPETTIEQGQTVIVMAGDTPVALARIVGGEIRPSRVLNI